MAPRRSPMRHRGVGFLIVFLTVAAGLVAYVALRLTPDGWSRGAQLTALLAVASLVALPLAALLLSQGRGPRLATALLPLGLFIFLLSFTALRDLLWLVAWLSALLPDDAATRQTLWNGTAVAAVMLSLVAFAFALLQARSGPTVVEVDVPIHGLHPSLHGFTIAQLSDVHIGRTLRRPFMQSVVDAVNALEADLVAITGDLVDGGVDELREHTAPLAELKSRHGTFFVLGNHDYYSGALSWTEELRSLGLRVLINTHDVLHHDGASLVVGGVTDHGMGGSIPGHESDPHRALHGAPDVFKLLLAHRPASATEASRAGFDLQLSGHTHGGQFFPGTLFAHLIYPFVTGLHKLDELWVYTSNGTGFVGPPLRTTRVATEVTRLRLVALPHRDA